LMEQVLPQRTIWAEAVFHECNYVHSNNCVKQKIAP